MKRTKLFLAAFLTLSFNVIAQPNYWGNVGTGGINTYTADMVGIGAGLNPTDAQLHVYAPTMTIGAVPELKIEKDFPLFGSSLNPNHFEIWNMPWGASPQMVDVINPNGWLGILQPSPAAELDVKGNGIIEKNLTVQGGQLNLTIPGDGSWSNVNANSGINGLTMSSGPWGAYIQMAAAYNTDPGSMQIVCGYQGSGTTF